MSCSVRKQKKCDENGGKLCNPKTGRCVKRNGKVGRGIKLDFNLYSVATLRQVASELKISGSSQMNKKGLVEALDAFRDKRSVSPKRRKPSLYNRFIAEEVPKIRKAKGCTVQEAFKLAAQKWGRVEESPTRKSPSPHKRKSPSPHKRKSPSPHKRKSPSPHKRKSPHKKVSSPSGWERDQDYGEYSVEDFKQLLEDISIELYKLHEYGAIETKSWRSLNNKIVRLVEDKNATQNEMYKIVREYRKLGGENY